MPLLALLFAVFLTSCTRQGPAALSVENEAPAGELVATYHPTPDAVVDRMLAMAAPREGELHYDLGSGDGRIVINAVRRYRTRSVGFEIDPALIRSSRSRLRRLGLENRAEIEARDLLTADLTAPDVITAFLTPEAFDQLGPLLDRQLRPGARLVSYKFPLPGWTPADVVVLDDPDPSIPAHEIFLYRR